MIKKYCTLIFVIALFITSCSNKTEDKTDDAKTDINSEFLQKIKTAEAELSNQKQSLILTGKVDYDPDKVIDYKPLVNGVVEKTYFSLGDKVQKGQVLLDIRSTDLSSLQSESVSAENEVRVAQREYQSAKSLFEDKMLSERELLEADAKLKQAQANNTKLKSDISTYGINKGNGVFSIKSPMSGYIVSKNAAAGSSVSSDGEAIFKIADLNIVWITANVYASNLQSVREGVDVDITTLSYPGEVFKGKINSLSQIFDPEEKVLKARIVMQNQDLKFKPEMSVVVKLNDQTENRLIAIPSDALIFDYDRYYVIVEVSKSQFEVRPVEINGHDNKTTYIRTGINPGETVVIKNQLLIYAHLTDK